MSKKDKDNKNPSSPPAAAPTPAPAPTPTPAPAQPPEQPAQGADAPAGSQPPPDADAPPAELRTDGPTVAEYVAAGYKASNYPPQGYASRSSDDEIKAAIDAENAPPKAPTKPPKAKKADKVRVRCDVANATSPINDVEFAEVAGADGKRSHLVSVVVDREVAESFARVPGYSILE